MLVLTVNTGDKPVVITTPAGERIEVGLESVRGNRVRLLFSAPKRIRINRWEVQETLDAAAKQGATVKAGGSA